MMHLSEYVIAIIGSGALSALITGLIHLREQKLKKDDGIKAGVRILLYDRIKHLGLTYIQQGYITADALEDLEHMHEIYHRELNGNGYLDSIMNLVRRLPIRN